MADDAERTSSDKPDDNATSPGLPAVDAPSLSPAETGCEPAQRPVPSEPNAAPRSARPRLTLFAAAAVLVAASLGGAVGALAPGAWKAPAVQERQDVQKSLARLTKEVAGLKADLAAAEKSARAQTARLADLDATLREKLARDKAAVTGSIAPAPAAPAVTPAAASAPSAPLPPPRPPMEEASTRGPIAEGWSVLGARRGFVYVQSGRDVYRVAPGARLPGLGLVEDVRHEDSGWVVVTRRGLIVASRDRF